MTALVLILFLFFFNDTATTEIYTLSLHDALPISRNWAACVTGSNTINVPCGTCRERMALSPAGKSKGRSEEHTSELQSHSDLVCRLLLEKKKRNQKTTASTTQQ